ncbi:hypothetical protein C5167_038257 [Papaver somniferum]|uniref:Uncharacterized protein n=1 Tax=Papaver somniferum TaxID=3469 RepID=A0A4Y7ID53_PAPSO|nr:hypothetical protein C5167_038257 [Papaver somniferum]
MSNLLSLSLIHLKKKFVMEVAVDKIKHSASISISIKLKLTGFNILSKSEFFKSAAFLQERDMTSHGDKHKIAAVEKLCRTTSFLFKWEIDTAFKFQV